MSLPEGWFPDPKDPAKEMRWDGRSWTGETRDVASPDPGAPTDAPGAEVQVAASTMPENSPRRRLPRRRVLIIAGIVALVLIAGGVTAGVLVQNAHNEQVAAAKAAAHKRAEERAAHAAAVKAEKESAERALRKTEVSAIEASVQKLAEDDVSKGILNGPILRASCDPVSGSTDDLTDHTTTFNCFVANKDNGDGTSSGYYFNSTMNWDSGSYTYGLGKAN